MSCFKTLESRGIIHQCSDPARLAALIDAGKATLYMGFDVTDESLHIGSLFGLCTLRRLQLAGNRVIVLLGGETTLIGDPSGRRSLRPLLGPEEVRRNNGAIRTQIARFVDFGGDNPATLVNNADWFGDMGLLDFLDEVGRYIPVNAMLSRDSVRQRFCAEEGLTFTEMIYQLFQAYDFLKLYREEGCTLQVGASDQWGNMTAGADLIRRATGGQGHLLTMPLITMSSGEKIGKSAGGAIWLDEARTSPFAFHQFWINVDDCDVERFFRFYTDLDLEEIAKLCAGDIRAAKRHLAFELTSLVFGVATAQAAEAISRAAIRGGSPPTDGFPALDLPLAEVGDGILAVDLFARAGLAGSKSSSHRLIVHGGAYLNGERIADPAQRIGADVLARGVVLRAGKKRVLWVRSI